MTDNEIIKALECCKTGDCENCPFYGIKEDCEVELPEEALDLINRQKAEIERLQHILISFMNEMETLERKYGADTSNIPKIAVLGTERENIIKQTKAEAIKEITKTIHTEIEKAIENNYVVKRDHQDKQNVINDEFVMYVDGKIHALGGIDDYIDNIVKEMVGENNG